MSFSQPNTLWFMLLGLLPVLLYIWRRFFRPRRVVASIQYLLEDDYVSQRIFDKESVKLSLQVLLLVLIPFIMAGPGGVAQRAVGGSEIVIYDDRFTSAFRPQGAGNLWDSVYEFAKERNLEIYKLSSVIENQSFEKITGKSMPAYHNQSFDWLNAVLVLDKTIYEQFKSKQTIHLFSTFCETGLLANPTDEPINNWQLHRLGAQTMTNAFIKKLTLKPDPTNAFRSFLQFKFIGKSGSTITLFIEDEKRFFATTVEDEQLFQIPLETKNTKTKTKTGSQQSNGRSYLTGSILISGDELEYDNNVRFQLPIIPKINIQVKQSAKGLLPLLKSVLTPQASYDRFKVTAIDAEKSPPNTITVNYGGQIKGIKPGSIWMYDGVSLPSEEFQAEQKIELVKGLELITDQAESLFFKRVLQVPPAFVATKLFSDGAPAVVTLADGITGVLFDPVSAAEDDFYKAGFPLFFHELFYQVWLGQNYERTFFGSTQVRANLGYVPEQPGFFGEKNNQVAYNADPTISACEIISDESLSTVFATSGVLNQNKQTSFFRADTKTLLLLFTILLACSYILLYYRRERK